ncbi:MAG TPA: MarR family transcriptional regulator [Solirubrobacteraceae bacterium]|nr:MarR family transcriptional regulator [Solirubrobacteraceae bacterium]
MVRAEAEQHLARAGEAQSDGPRISYVIARLERAIRRAINDRVSRYGLTVLQYTTLSVLGRRGGLSNAQLARRAYMSPQSMSEVIEALEAKGFVERRPHPNHRRVFPATLTAEGRRVLDECEQAVDQMEREMLAGLSPIIQEHLREGALSAVRALHAGFPTGKTNSGRLPDGS